MKKAKELVFCQNNCYGALDFFLVADGKEVYLFRTNYFSRSIYAQYRNGQRIDQLFKKTAKVREQKLKERILRMMRYVSEAEIAHITKKSRKPIRSFRNEMDVCDCEEIA